MNDHKILVGVSPILKVTPKVCLVGNSDRLLQKDYSREIDSYKTIIRFNYGNILTKYTGKKTDIRFLQWC